MYQSLIHPYPPVFDENSRILILGSFPSVKSREEGFYYGHPQNRFYPVLARILNCAVPRTVEEKRAMLTAHGVALWDVIASCDIEGSSDASIKNALPNDISLILDRAQVGGIFTNGATAHSLYMKYIFKVTCIEDVKLPSTSPANAAYSIERLYTEWSRLILPALIG